MREKIDKFLVISIDCWRYDALSRTNALFNTPKFDLLTRDFNLAEHYFVAAPATRPARSRGVRRPAVWSVSIAARHAALRDHDASRLAG